MKAAAKNGGVYQLKTGEMKYQHAKIMARKTKMKQRSVAAKSGGGVSGGWQ